MKPSGPNPLAGAFGEIGAGAWSLWRGAAGLPGALSTTEPFGERRLARTMQEYIWRPLGTLAALGALTGVIAGLLCANLLKRFHAELAVVPPITNLLLGQIAPILVGVFAAGRVSVALTARLGGMQFQGEIDALSLRGREPAGFVLGPVLASLLIGAPILTLLVDGATLSTVGLMLQTDSLVPLDRFLRLIASSETAAKTLAGVGRAYVYLILAAAAGGAAGSMPMLDLGDLEQRTSAAFTSGLLLIFLAAAVMAI